jgi:homoserine dehydrogenase
VEQFLDKARADVLVELTPLNPVSGEPAISHIRAAFARGLHVVTANKGPVAHAYAALKEEADRAGVQFLFEATVLDGAPIFRLVRRTLPGVRLLGFTGVLNSTSTIVIEAMERNLNLEDGVEQARQLGVTEADPWYDLAGWDAATKTAVLANVLMDARTKPQEVDTRGIGRLTAKRMTDFAAKGKTVRLVSRARRTSAGIRLRVRAEVLNVTDLLASTSGTSNLLLLHLDEIGTIGVVSVSPTLEQTAYGIFTDLVEIFASCNRTTQAVLN